MCGIIGYAGDFSPEQLTVGSRRQAHRGPDARGEYVDRSAGIGLAHVRLSIIDISEAGCQPMSVGDGDVIIVYNGEIYNYRELRSQLETAGRRFRSQSDTEVILQLYQQHGDAMLPLLNGIFALAIWDRRNGSMLIARDALGVKPLYFVENERGVAFASEIKALLALVPEAAELDPPSIHRYLSFLWCPGEGTPLRAVHKLSPGSAMIVRDGKVTRRWTWYQLPAFRSPHANLGAGEAVAGTAAHLRTAVQRQLVADVPVGAFLSGGLDSSAIVAFAREENPAIRCFTIETTGGQEEGMADDLPYARRVAKHLNVALDVVTIDASAMAEDFAMMIAQLDEPLADPAPLNVLYISRLARSHGIKVLLSGAGGDDLFSGYRRHLALAYEGTWSWLPSGARSLLQRGSAALDQRRPAARRLAKLFSGAGLDQDVRLANYFVWAREEELFKLYTPAFAAEVGAEPAAEPLLGFLRALPAGTPPLERMLALEQRFFLTDHNLTYTDKMSMAAGVEVRVPYLDLDLVDFAARIPNRFKQRGRTGKWVLKQAMAAYLPADVIHRPKTGFGAPLRRWMRHELKPLLDDLLSEESLRRRGMFDPDAVSRLRAENSSGRVDAAYTLLSLLSIELWCRAYLDTGVLRAEVSTPHLTAANV